MERARQLYEESLKLKEEIGDKKGKAASLHQMAQVYLTRGDLERARQLYEESLKLKEEIGDKKGKAASLGQMADIFMARREWEQAEQLLLQALSLVEAIGEPPAFEVVKLGQIAEGRGDAHTALTRYREGLAIFESLGMPRECEQVRRMIANLEGGAAPLAQAVAQAKAANERGDLPAAIQAQEQAVALARQDGQGRDELVTLSVLLFNLAGFYRRTGQHAQAVRALEEVVALDERTGHPDLESDRQALAEARRAAQSPPAEGEPGIEAQLAALPPEQRAQAEAAVRAFQNMSPEEQATAMRRASLAQAVAQARAADARGDLPAAIQAQEQAVALARQGGQGRDELVTLSVLLFNLAGLYTRAGQHAQAVQALEEVVALDERTGHPDLESDRQALAEARRAAQSPPAEEEPDIEAQLAALPPEQRAQAEAAVRAFQNMSPEEQATAMRRASLAQAVAQARAADARGDLPAAIQAQEQAVALARQGGQGRDELVTLSVLLFNLAGFYRRAGQHAQAVRALEEVVALDARTGHPDLESDRQALVEARRAEDNWRALQNMSPEEQDAARAAASRAQREAAVKAMCAAALAYAHREAPQRAVLDYLQNLLAQIDEGEQPGSPWHEVGRLCAALIAAVAGQPVPPVPAAYVGQLAGVRTAIAEMHPQEKP